MQQTGDPRERRTRIVADQRCCRAGVRSRTFEHDNSRTRSRQLATVARLRQVRHRMAVRIRKRPDSLNERIGTAAKLTAKSNSEFPERNGHCAVPERPVVPATRAYF